MDILTPLQKNFIHKFSESSFQKSFFLTGGTALAAFYLKHRLSEDLDFFTEEEGLVRQVLPWLQKTADVLNLKLEVQRQTQSFLCCYFHTQGDDPLKIDFAQDSPFRLEKTQLQAAYQIYVDNLTDISCNKLSALYDRAESKDFVDLYFLSREFLPFDQILAKAKHKHIGLEDYWLAQALQRVETLSKLPRMLKPVTLEDLKKFFLPLAKSLIQK